MEGQWVLRDQFWKQSESPTIECTIQRDASRAPEPTTMAQWSVALKELPNTYFEAELYGYSASGSETFIGLCPKGFTSVAHKVLNTEGGCWPLPAKRGRRRGWGIDKHSHLFYTEDGKITYMGSLPNEFGKVYPFIQTNGSEKFHFYVDVPNPSKVGPYVAGPSSQKKTFELVGNPFGQVDYSNLPKTTDSSFWRLPADVLKSIQQLSGVELTSVCRSLHNVLFPALKYLDYHGERNKIPGRYIFNRHKVGFFSLPVIDTNENSDHPAKPCYTLAYELKADGTVTGLKRFLLGFEEEATCTPIRGVWALTQRQTFEEFKSDAIWHGNYTYHSAERLSKEFKAPLGINFSDETGLFPRVVWLHEQTKVDVTQEVWDRKYVNPKGDVKEEGLQPKRKCSRSERPVEFGRNGPRGR